MSTDSQWKIQASPEFKPVDVTTTIAKEDREEFQKLANEIEALIEIQKDFGWVMGSQQENLDNIELNLEKTEVIAEETSETLTETVKKVDKQRRAGLYAAGGGVLGGVAGFLLGSLAWVAGPQMGIPVQFSLTVIGAGAGAGGGGLAGMMKKSKAG